MSGFNTKRKDWISKAKGFGILGVVVSHTVQRFSVPPYLSSVAYAGSYCVQLFFVISAYLTFISLEKTSLPLSHKGFIGYMGHKLIRLAPVLYTAVLLHIVMNYPVFFGERIENNAYVWKNAFFAVTFLNGFSYNHINPWANWYIGDLVIFWAIAPLLFGWISTVKKSVWFFIVSMAFAWMSNLLFSIVDIDNSWYFYFWLPNQLPVLAIGIMYYHFQKNSLLASKNSIMTLAFVVSTCLLLSFIFFTTPMEIHVRYGLLLFVFTYLLFNNTGKWFNWLKVLGDNSYGIYLYHCCLMAVFDYFVNKFAINKESVPNFFCYYILLVLVSLAFAKLANVLIEKPFFKYMKRKYEI